MEYNKSMYLKIIKNTFFYTLTRTHSYFIDCISHVCKFCFAACEMKKLRVVTMSSATNLIDLYSVQQLKTFLRARNLPLSDDKAEIIVEFSRCVKRSSDEIQTKELNEIGIGMADAGVQDMTTRGEDFAINSEFEFVR